MSLRRIPVSSKAVKLASANALRSYSEVPESVFIITKRNTRHEGNLAHQRGSQLERRCPVGRHDSFARVDRSSLTRGLLPEAHEQVLEACLRPRRQQDRRRARGGGHCPRSLSSCLQIP